MQYLRKNNFYSIPILKNVLEQTSYSKKSPDIIYSKILLTDN